MADETVTETIWQGYLAGARFTGNPSLPVVEMSCQDWLGLAARTDAPETAFADAIGRLVDPAPQHWWRPGTSGWEDRITGWSAPHTAGLVELDPVVDGDSKPGGQVEPDGHALITTGLPDLESVTDWHVVSLWFRCVLDLASGGARLLWVGHGRRAGFAFPIRFQVDAYRSGGVDSIHIDLETSTTFGQWQSSAGVPMQFNADRPHHLMLRWRQATDPITVWLDGAPIAGSQSGGAGGSGTDDEAPQMWIGGANVWAMPHYQGVIDHVMVWPTHPGTEGDLDTVAAALYDAGRRAWAGQRLDERFTAVTATVGTHPDRATATISGVVTQQGYRPAADVVGLLRTVEETEQGLVWCDREGAVRFSPRSWAWKGGASPVAWFSDIAAPGRLPMATAPIVSRADPDRVTNSATVTSTHGRAQSVEDAASIAAHGRRATTLSGLLHPTDRQSRSIASWLLYQRATPVDVVTEISFRVDDAAALLGPLAQTIDICDLVAVDVEGDTYHGHVRRVGHDISAAGHTVTIGLDPDRTGRTWFRLSTSPIGGTDPLAF